MSRSSRTVLLREKERTDPALNRLSSSRGGEILPPGASRRRVIWSALVGLPGWAAVGFVFWEALKQPAELVFPLALWIGFLALAALTGLAWTRYAKRPAVVERKRAATGREAGGPVREPFQVRDALGREIRVDSGASTARVVVVRVEGETKTVSEGS